MSLADGIGSLGVALLLIAFFLHQRGFLHREGMVYLILNVVGAGLACLASWQIGFLPFVVLEGAWCLVALIELVKIYALPQISSAG